MLAATTIRNSLECYLHPLDPIKISRETLSTVTNWHELVVLSENEVEDTELYELILERMTKLLPEILPTITSWHELMEIWKNTINDSVEEELAESRMAEFLSTTNDWYRLVVMLENTPKNIAPSYLINRRMDQLLNTVTDNDVPDWFISLLEDDYSCPTGLRPILTTKANELFQRFSA